MTAPWLIDDPRFPGCRTDRIDDGAVQNWMHQKGLTFDGLAFPGIIDIGNLLGTGAYECASLSEPEIRSNPSTGADAIVTILYQHRPSLLRQFLNSKDFDYLHYFDKKTHSEDEKHRQHFFISRKDDQVMSGYFDGHNPDRDGEDWISLVQYFVTPDGRWRQVKLECPDGGLDSDTKHKKRLQCGRTEHHWGRINFEDWASQVLAPAIKQRRWFRQPGSLIEIN